MHHLIYLSQTTVPFSTPQLKQLLLQARQFNAAHNLTGILFYGNDQFFQVLEGDSGTVHALYERICQDPRHQNIIIYDDNKIAQRSFPDWQMAYRALPPQQVIEFVGYISPTRLQLERTDVSEDDQQLQLLRTLVLSEGDEVA